MAASWGVSFVSGMAGRWYASTRRSQHPTPGRTVTHHHEIQSAQFGMQVPPHIQIEVDTINEKN